MNILRKVIIALKSVIISKRNGVYSVKIRDYANAHISPPRGVTGAGMLRLNPNAIRSNETMRLRLDKNAKLVIDGDVSFFTNTNIHIGQNGVLSIGDGTYVNDGTKIAVRRMCTIGKHCAISNDVTILDSDFHSIDTDSNVDTGVIIGDHVWIGTNAIILKNVRIGNGCIIGAGSVVLHDIPDGCIAAGNPAKIIRENVTWK